MEQGLVSWIGKTDLLASEGQGDRGDGPLAEAIRALRFDHAFLLCNYPKEDTDRYIDWLRSLDVDQMPTIELTMVELATSPIDHDAIYQAVVPRLEAISKTYKDSLQLTFHLSPGTPAMHSVWLLLGKTLFPARLIQSSREHGVREYRVPFDISAEYVSAEALKVQDRRLEALAQGLPPDAPEFSDIVYRSKEMQRIVGMAQRVAARNVTVLIEGESGTGKELIARAIHRASLRKDGPYRTINCGAIPESLIESEIFGHIEGAFTGAKDRPGLFESANHGTVFLDEIGELPLSAQVKLLRVLQEGEFTRVGESVPRTTDVRIIAATNRRLIDEVSKGHFRKDLFYRLAIAVIQLPPLRDRRSDLPPLIDHFLAKLNGRMGGDGDPISLSPGAKNVLAGHSWPGNVRELENTLARALVWSTTTRLTKEEMEEAILHESSSDEDPVLDRPLGDGLDIREIQAQVTRHYLERALEEGRTLQQAAELVGLKHYQTFKNWMDKYGIQARGAKS